MGFGIKRPYWRPLGGGDAASIAAVAAILFGFAARLFARPGAHLWIDETFTGAIATQATLSEVIYLAHLDAPPSAIYYVLMHFWTLVFGASNAALRAPSVICGLMAPMIIAIAPMPQLSRADRLTWAALVALSPAVIGFGLDARSYALVVALATGQTVAYAWLLARPTLRGAVVWIVLAVLAIEAHYDAAYLALAQGLLFLGVWRRDALRLWPAALFILPAVGELIWKWPVLSRFEAPGTAWYPLLTAAFTPVALVYPLSGFGVGLEVWFIGLPILLLAAVLLRRGPAPPSRAAPSWTALSAALGFGAMVIVGMVRPSFWWSYEGVFIPGVALCLVLVLRALARDRAPVFSICALAMGAWACAASVKTGAPRLAVTNDLINIEEASQSLTTLRSKPVLFAWDSPTARVMDPDLLKSVGQFFFVRADQPVTVIPVRLAQGDDPNAVLFTRAAKDHAGIIFLFDTAIPNTVAGRHPLGSDPRFFCRHFTTTVGSDLKGSVACRPLT